MDKLSVLVVEDERVNRAILVRILQATYDVLEAEDGQQALDMLETEKDKKIDMILLDLVMPVMDGITFLERKKETPSIADIPVIVTTSNTDSETEAKAFALGVDDFVTKPYNSRILLRRVNNMIEKYVLEKRHMQDALDKTSEELSNLIDTVPGGIAIFEIRDYVSCIYRNDGFCEMLGYTPKELEEMQGRDTLSAIYAEDIPLIQDKIKRANRTGEKVQATVRVYKKDKSLIWIAITAQKLKTRTEYPQFHAVFLDVTEEKKIAREMEATLFELQYRTKWDVITGVYNRNTFYAEAQKMMSDNPTTTFVVAVWDVDHFKMINELFGNNTGDLILARVGKILSENIPKGTGVFGRLEADHFATCAPISVYVQTKDKMRAYIEHGLQGDIVDYPIYAHVGLYRVEDNMGSIGTMCDRAKLAIQNIKTDAMERYCFYRNDMSRQLYLEQELINDFETAITERQFFIQLQPIVDTVTGEVISAEALVRWNHPEKGFISPGDFVPIFEKNGFITELDYYVWDEVCHYLGDNIKNGIANVPISINISRKNFLRQNLEQKLTTLLRKYHVPVRLLKLEVTESAYMDHPEEMLATIHTLQEKGFVILMDDFGSGFSSLNMLKDVPVDILKIDMLFVRELEKSQRGSEILYSVVDMTKRIHMQTVAEGVETKKQFQVLKRMGCDSIQGYYFSKPLLPDDFRTYVSEHKSSDFLKQELEKDKKTVLVVDDDELVRIVSKRALSQYNVLTAEDGQKALEILEQYKKDISFVLTDIVMPELDGFELIKSMKENTNLKDIPVMVLTAEGSSKMALSALAMGAIDIIDKPVQPNVLRARIGNIIG